jgi:hypothetical protein
MARRANHWRSGVASMISRCSPSGFTLVGLLAAYIATICAYPYFPTQDGPSHIYNSYVLAQLLRGEGPLNGAFAVRTELVPNWGGHGLMVALIMLGVPPLGAEKVLVSAYLVGVAFASHWLNRSVGGGQQAWSPWSVPLAFNFPIFMGFYNFAIGVPVALAMLAFVWRRRASMSARATAVLSALLVVLFLTHLVAYSIGLFLLAAIFAVDGETRERGWLRRMRILALAALPSLALLAWYVVMSDGEYLDAQRTWRLFARPEDSMSERLSRLVFALLAPTPWHRTDFALLVSSGLSLVVLWRIFTIARSKGIAAFAAVRASNGPIVVAWAALLALAVILPREWGHHGGYFTDRAAVFLGLLMLAWLPVPRYPVATHLPAVLAFVVGLTLLYWSTAYLDEWNRFIVFLREGATPIPIGSSVLPLSCNTLVRGRIEVIEHVGDYDCLSPGVVNWDNYEARGFCFPVRYAPGVVPPEIGPIKGGDLSGLDSAMARSDVVLLWKPSRALEAKVAAEFPAVSRPNGLVIRSRYPLLPAHQAVGVQKLAPPR